MIDQENNNSDSSETEARPIKLCMFTRGSAQFAILDSEIVAIDDWRAPASLPHAPESVLGVVSIQGRMLTVLDLAKIVEAKAGLEKTNDANGQQKILALRGDEQLALVVDTAAVPIEVPVEAMNKTGTRELLTTIHHDGAEFKVLNPKQLFPSAIQGRERRRRRF